MDLGLGPVTEVGFNALHNRQGFAMTNTQALTEPMRPQGTNNLFVAWETLTRGEPAGSQLTGHHPAGCREARTSIARSVPLAVR